MLKDGEIKEIGTYNQLRNNHSDFDEFLGTSLDSLENHHEKTYKFLINFKLNINLDHL